MPESDREALKVLMIEDNRMDAIVLKKLLMTLKYYDCQVRETETLAVALEVLAEDAFGLIIIDLGLPDSFGENTVAKVRKVSGDTPLVVLTGNDDEELARSALRIGAQEYLIKGQINSFILNHAIRFAIERQTLVVERQATILELEEMNRKYALSILELSQLNDKLKEEINSRKRAEEALVDSQVSLMKAQAVAHVGSWEWDLRTNMYTISKEMGRIYGLSIEEQIGEDVQALISAAVHPEDRSYVDEAMAMLAIGSLGQELYFQIIRPDNELRWIRADQPQPKRVTSEGRPEILVGTVQDITERKEAQRALQEAHAQLEMLFDASEDYICVINPQRMITRVNEPMAALFGGSKSDLEGKRCSNLFDLGICESEQCILQQMLAGEDLVEVDSYGRLGGDLQKLKLRGTALRDHNGKLISQMVVFQKGTVEVNTLLEELASETIS
ncbi:MAG: PAS domain S-box protein [bacterium]|nr:PAS domain S-box protein [bacterium]